MQKNKAVVWFSCGAASAVASKYALKKYGNDVDIVYCDTGGEHESNMTFLKDCEKWFQRKIIILKNPKYKDHLDVMDQHKFITNVHGYAPCTHELKMKLRQDAGYCDSINIFGYTLEEQKRSKKLQEHNIDMICEFPLIENKVTKEDCLGMIWQSGIELPLMYKLGYSHNNCIGCVKGGLGYWNKIKKDFPEHFEKMSKLEKKLGLTILKYRSGEKEGQRMYLDELKPHMGNYMQEPSITCGIDCHMNLEQIEE